MENFESLRIALRIISQELEDVKAENELLTTICADLFPYDAYNQVRPDVDDWSKGEHSAILKHYIKHGNKELSIKDVAESQKQAFSNRSINTAVKFFRDASDTFAPKDIETKMPTEKRMLRLSKTIGDCRSLENNQDHKFAQNNTLLHHKSNSICTWIPKNACSNLRYSIALANGIISSIEDIEWIHNNTGSVCATNEEILKASYCFVILRNPFKRLLSFFLDKICHKSSNSQSDKSYKGAHELFKTTDETTFEDFVSSIWRNPDLIEMDIHLKPQTDFLVYKKYDDYYQFEDFPKLEARILEKINLKIADVRDFNTIHTSKHHESAEELNSQTCIGDLKKYLSEGKKPIASNMYTNSMTKKAGTIYFNDIFLYIKEIKNGVEEMRSWIHKMIKY